MDFLNNLTEKGFTVKCMVEGENEYENNKGSFNIIVNDDIILPEELSQSMIYLISTIATHFVDDVYDPFNYNNNTNKSEVFINNRKYEFELDNEIIDLFLNTEDVPSPENDDISFLQKDLFNHILEKIQILNGNNYIYQDKFLKLKTMPHISHVLCSIRNNKKKEIGYGKIFTPH